MTASIGRSARVQALVGTAVTVVLVGVVQVPEAQAHSLGYDSVDACEIRWEDETIWDAERQAAQSAWEALKGGDGCVDLAPDAWNTNADLEWKDANRSDVSWAGLYENEPNADDIFLNTFFLQSYGSCMRKNIAMHELGHAHGFDHSSNSSTGNVMNVFAISVCSLKDHDILDYWTHWGNPSPPPPPPPEPCPRCVEPAEPPPDPGTVHHAETVAVTDLADDRKLVGFADDVFLGTVVRQRGQTTSDPLPETQFDVQVQQTVKGSSTGTVIVSQQGGRDDEGGTVVVDGDQPLQIGRTYLFAARTNRATGWRTLVPRYGTVAADTTPTQASLLDRFNTARAAEVPYAPES